MVLCDVYDLILVDGEIQGMVKISSRSQKPWCYGIDTYIWGILRPWGGFGVGSVLGKSAWFECSFEEHIIQHFRRKHGGINLAWWYFKLLN